MAWLFLLSAKRLALRWRIAIHTSASGSRGKELEASEIVQRSHSHSRNIGAGQLADRRAVWSGQSAWITPNHADLQDAKAWNRSTSAPGRAPHSAVGGWTALRICELLRKRRA